jgi:membrane peptidoglycan carboxypeptidase
LGDKHEECFDRQAGVLLAGQLSRDQVNQSGIPPSPRWALSQVATMADLTRNWNIDQVLDTLAATGYFGHGWKGVYAASEGFFGKPASDLSAAEAAAIAMQIPYPKMTDPWTRMEAAIKRRNALLQRMHRSGVLDDAALEAALVSPITVKPLPATWDSPRNP